jgi:hypothetical protein
VRPEAVRDAHVYLDALSVSDVPFWSDPLQLATQAVEPLGAVIVVTEADDGQAHADITSLVYGALLVMEYIIAIKADAPNAERGEIIEAVREAINTLNADR